MNSVFVLTEAEPMQLITYSDLRKSVNSNNFNSIYNQKIISSSIDVVCYWRIWIEQILELETR